MPSDPRFFELPPPPGAGPSLEERFSRLAEGEDRDERERDPAEPVEIIPGSVDAHVGIARSEDAEAYQEHRHRHPLERAVLVQEEPGPRGRETLVDALQVLSTRDEHDTDLARGIAIVDDRVSETELRDLDAAGVRAARFPMQAEGGPLGWEELGRIAARVHDLVDWDVSLRMDGGYLAEVETMILSWPGRVLLEGFGGFRKPVGGRDNGMRAILRLMDRDKLWVSLAGEGRVSLDGYPRFRDLHAITRQLARFAPERLVWGSDWPHATDAADSHARLGEWLEDDGLRHRIMVDNPAQLFRFGDRGVSSLIDPPSNSRR